MGFILFLLTVAAMITSVAYTLQILNRTKPLWVILAYVFWVVILFVGGIALTTSPERGWILFLAWLGLAATGPVIATKEWSEVAKVLTKDLHVLLFSKKVEIGGKIYTVPPHVTSLTTRKPRDYGHRYNIMFKDEVVIEDVFLNEEDLATFPRSL